MKLTKTSIISGKENTMEIPITREMMENFVQWSLENWKSKGHIAIQDAFPELSDDEREFIISGITPEEWTEKFGKEE